jgi:hypothetical protein
MGLICKTWLAGGLPAVILNLVRDDLRMMALKPVAARESGMKDIEECIGYFMRLSSKGLPKSVRQRQRSCLFGRDLRSLWQTDFATPKTGSRLKSPHQTATRFGGEPTGRDDTEYSLADLFWTASTINTSPRHHEFLSTISPFHLQRSCRSCHPRSISIPPSHVPFRRAEKAPEPRGPGAWVYRLHPMSYFIRIIFLVLLYLPVLIL